MTIFTPESAESLKARGGFYTPRALTSFLSRWAIRTADDRVLEPSCGDGAFVVELARRFDDLGRMDLDGHLLAVEREPAEASKARALAPGVMIKEGDFFDLDPDELGSLDAVVGNPPYVRYHSFNGVDREKGLARAWAQGVELTQLASSWAHFVVHAAAFLKAGGRLALVLPAELLHTDYAAPVRAYLLRRFTSVTIIAFDRAAFEDAQVDAVLLLASDDRSEGLNVIRVADKQALRALEDVRGGSSSAGSPDRWSAAVDDRAGRAYKAAKEAGLGQPLGAFASVDIGFVTGANAFFVLSPEDAAARGLPAAVLTTAIRRPRDVPGLIVHEDELSLLLDLAGTEAHLDPATAAYIQEGEESGVADRYKCRVRRPWYAVPLPRRRPDAFIPYMSSRAPRLIVNSSGAWSTNLLHGVALSADAAPPEALAVAMTSSLTLLSAEVEGRAYGGGVLKLETREAERLLVPRFTTVQAERLANAFGELDAHVRAGQIRDAARCTDGILGIDHATLWRAYQAFADRRLTRRSRAGTRRAAQMASLQRSPEEQASSGS